MKKGKKGEGSSGGKRDTNAATGNTNTYVMKDPSSFKLKGYYGQANLVSQSRKKSSRYKS